LDASHVAALAQLGRWWFERKNPERGRALLERAAALAPDDAGIRADLARLDARAAPESSDERGEPAGSELRLASRPVGASVILVVNDAMRRDALSAYGGRARTPRFDRFAAENLLFESAMTQAPWTTPSVATLFTSLYPSQHRLASHPV